MCLVLHVRAGFRSGVFCCLLPAVSPMLPERDRTSERETDAGRCEYRRLVSEPAGAGGDGSAVMGAARAGAVVGEVCSGTLAMVKV